MKTEAQVKARILEYIRILEVYNNKFTDEGKASIKQDIDLLHWILSDVP